MSIFAPGEEVESPQEVKIECEEDCTCEECGQNDRIAPPHPGAHGGGLQPELEDDEQPAQHGDTADDRVILRAGAFWF
jgi:hypothetical protein